MPSCYRCGVYYNGRSEARVDPHVCGSCSRAVPVQRAQEVPVTVEATVIVDGKPIGKVPVPAKPKVERVRRTRYDILGSGGLDLGVHFEEGSDVEKP